VNKDVCDINRNIIMISQRIFFLFYFYSFVMSAGLICKASLSHVV